MWTAWPGGSPHLTKQAIAETKRLVDIASLPSDAEIAKEWMPSRPQPGAKLFRRTIKLMSLGFHRHWRCREEVRFLRRSAGGIGPKLPAVSPPTFVAGASGHYGPAAPASLSISGMASYIRTRRSEIHGGLQAHYQGIRIPCSAPPGSRTYCRLGRTSRSFGNIERVIQFKNILRSPFFRLIGVLVPGRAILHRHFGH